MSVKVISKDGAGNPKRYFFTDVVDDESCSCKSKQDTKTEDESTASDNELSIGEQSRQRMIQRSLNAWKK